MVSGEIHTITKDDADLIIKFIGDALEGSGCEGLIVGASGGIDSAVTAKLCADAVGPERVMNVFMPSAVTPSSDLDLTMSLSRLWGTRYECIGIQPAVDALAGMLSLAADDRLGIGNISSRCRMTVLYNRARDMNYLVAGTSNRSECMMGYFTKFGDWASDILPIADLYKTQVRQIAKLIGVPRDIVEKVPTAGLWTGQTDESEMGITYNDLDIILNGINLGRSDTDMADRTGICIMRISEIRERVGRMRHKILPAMRPDVAFNGP